jgi:Flp pilus assembly protein TadD
MASANRRSRLLRAGTAIVAVLALSLASGCARDRTSTGSVSASSSSATGLAKLSATELDGLVRKYGAKYDRDPKDKTVGLSYASLLRMTGRDEQSLAVMRKLVIHHPKDNDILSAYGKSLAATGNFTEALAVIQRAQRPENPDWRLLSAEATILDQLDRPAEARELYRKALDIAPGEPTVLSNLGMSYVLTNDLNAAETYLRKAIAAPGADSRVRQNLALVVGLQGRFEEAERIAAGELPPGEAAANVAYLRQMLAQQNSWNQLKAADGKKS